MAPMMYCSSCVTACAACAAATGAAAAGGGACLVVHQFHLTESVYKVVLQKSIPAQIREFILCFHQFLSLVGSTCCWTGGATAAGCGGGA